MATPAGLTAHEKQNYDDQKNKAHSRFFGLDFTLTWKDLLSNIGLP
jgi:hypothetical protein